jgi:hypothetical protein
MPKALPENRCQQISAHGRQCRSLRAADHPSLCSYHASQSALAAQTSNLEPQNSNTAADLLGPVHDFRTAASINHVLGKLLVLVNTQRISPRNAAVTAYICQLLLQSLREVKGELYDFHSTRQENWPEFQRSLKKILKADSVPPELPANSESAEPALAGVSRATS